MFDEMPQLSTPGGNTLIRNSTEPLVNEEQSLGSKWIKGRDSWSDWLYGAKALVTLLIRIDE